MRRIAAAGLLLLSILFVLVGAAWLYSGVEYYLFLQSGDAEAIAICLTNPSLDCHADDWMRFLGLGSLSLLSGLGLLYGTWLLRKKPTE